MAGARAQRVEKIGGAGHRPAGGDGGLAQQYRHREHDEDQCAHAVYGDPDRVVGVEHGHAAAPEIIERPQLPGDDGQGRVGQTLEQRQAEYLQHGIEQLRERAGLERRVEGIWHEGILALR